MSTVTKEQAFPCGSDPSIGNASSFTDQSALTSREMMTVRTVDKRKTPAIKINIVKSLLYKAYTRSIHIPILP
jgi:hypothetical protein